ncbi:MAG: PKD domain-containing protein [Saprospiraceae bacterium]|nr:PKD domain-containing protein [Saprospiraceae bacterium]
MTQSALQQYLSLILHPSQSCPNNPNFSTVSLTWENTEGYPINSIILTPVNPGTAIVIFVFVDDIVITNNCADACFTTSTDCPDVTFIPCNLGMVQTHLWNFGDQSTSTAANPTHTYQQNGTYTVTHTVTDDCGNTDVETLQLVISCPTFFACPCGPGGLNIGAPGQTTLLSSLGFNGWLPSGCVAVDGTLVIDQGLYVLWSEFKMQPGSQIIITSGNILNVGISAFNGCEQMWKGIKVESGGTLLSGYNAIRDAQFGVHALGGSKLWVQNTYFDKDYVGIYGEGGGITLLNNLSGNQFICNGSLLPPYSGQTPAPAGKTYAGIALNSVNGFSVGVEGNAGTVNTFTGIHNGIVAINSTFNAHNCNISNMIGTGDSGTNIWANYGKGVLMLNCPQGTVTRNRIITNDRGVACWNSNAKVNQNKIGSTITGILFRDAPNKNLEANYNGINASWTGVQITRCSPANKLMVLYDTITNNVNYAPAIGVASSYVNTEGNASISNNIIKANGGSHGISLTSSWTFKVNDNSIKSLGSGVDFAGLHFWNSKHCQVRNNKVVGPNVLGYNGIYAYNTPDMLYCCNNVGFTRNGVRFQGGCDETRLGTTQFGNHFHGLRYDGSGVTGKQEWMGNSWNANCLDYDASHAGDALLSPYFVSPDQVPNDADPSIASGDWFTVLQKTSPTCGSWSNCGNWIGYPLRPPMTTPS